VRCVKFILAHISFILKSNSEMHTLILHTVTDKTKLASFYDPRCIMVIRVFIIISNIDPEVSVWVSFTFVIIMVVT